MRNQDISEAAMKGQQNPRAWLEPKSGHGSSKHMACSAQTAFDQQQDDCVTPHHGLTNTMMRAGEYQNMLTAVPHPHTKTGYKSAADPCNRSDKRNGGEFRRFESSYSKDYASIDNKPIQFREDGLPISARMVPGKPLMAPKMPNGADLSVAKRLFAKYNQKSSITLGNPRNKDPRHFKSVSQIVHAAPHRQLGQPNPGIAAEDAARAHRNLGLFN